VLPGTHQLSTVCNTLCNPAWQSTAEFFHTRRAVRHDLGVNSSRFRGRLVSVFTSGSPKPLKNNPRLGNPTKHPGRNLLAVSTGWRDRPSSYPHNRKFKNDFRRLRCLRFRSTDVEDIPHGKCAPHSGLKSPCLDVFERRGRQERKRLFLIDYSRGDSGSTFLDCSTRHFSALDSSVVNLYSKFNFPR
jgi:hypothetical protein